MCVQILDKVKNSESSDEESKDSTTNKADCSASPKKEKEEKAAEKDDVKTEGNKSSVNGIAENKSDGERCQEKPTLDVPMKSIDIKEEPVEVSDTKTETPLKTELTEEERMKNEQQAKIDPSKEERHEIYRRI